jgi:3-keto-disaccharide hydrolase
MRNVFVSTGILLLVLGLFVSLPCFAQEAEPAVVSALPGNVPSDAIVLFGGTDLSEWLTGENEPARWIVANGTMMVNKGGIYTKKEFGDIQLHLEFCSPDPPVGEGQDRGNSGVYFQRNYEVQILDSYINKTYTYGQCGAVYQISPPLVNASRPPGIWQTYDIIFRAPKLGSDGKVVKKANVTVLHNGVLIQDHLEVVPTGGSSGSAEVARGAILLQDHNHPVKYRNIWVREL